MALKFNGTSIYSINYNNQDVLNLQYNGNSIWAKRYTDAKIYEVERADSDGGIYNKSVDSLSPHRLERISSLDASPSPFSYSNYYATVHWGDAFRATGGTYNSYMTLPSGDNIRIDTDRVIHLSGRVRYVDNPRITLASDNNETATFTLSQFSEFGEAYYTTYWNGVRNGEKASEFCRCWIQFLKMSYTGNTIKSLELFPTNLFYEKKDYEYDDNYDPEIGGWVLSPSDYVRNNNGFRTFGHGSEGIFQKRSFRTYSGTSGVPVAWRVVTCYKTGWGHQHAKETYGSTISGMDKDDVARGFYTSSLAAVKKVNDDSMAWVNEKPYDNS